jgi:CHAT domain-containing protein
MIHNKGFIFLVISLFFLVPCGETKAQDTSKKIDALLFNFYQAVQNQKSQEALNLTNVIDLAIKKTHNLTNKQLVNYYNSKGIIYFKLNKNPEKFFIIADSLNNTLNKVDLNIKIYSNLFLGNYYLNIGEDLKARNTFLKIFHIENLPEDRKNIKNQILELIFSTEKILAFQDKIDSSVVLNTADKLISLKRKENDTINISFGEALEFVKKGADAEKIFIELKNIPRTSFKYRDEIKFVALSWLRLNYNNKINIINIKNNNKSSNDSINAIKLLETSKELLNFLNDKNYLLNKSEYYSIYADIVHAAIILKDNQNKSFYQEYLFELIKDDSYLSDKELDLQNLFYLFERLSWIYYYNNELDKLFIFKKNELRVFDVIKEQNINEVIYLSSISNILKSFGDSLVGRSDFDFEQSYKYFNKYKQLVLERFGKYSIEYLEVSNQEYTFILKLKNDGKHSSEKLLEHSKTGLEILKDMNCITLICDKIKLNYAKALNSNSMCSEALKFLDSSDFNDNIEIFIRKSSIRREAYSSLNNLFKLNFEFEELLSRVQIEDELFYKDPNIFYEYLNNILDYQKYLKNSGRTIKALSLTKEFFDTFKKLDVTYAKSEFFLNYIEILVLNNQYDEAINLLEYDFFDSKYFKENDGYYQYRLFKLIGIIKYNKGEYAVAKEFFKNTLKNKSSNKRIIYIELIRIASELEDKKSTQYYLEKLKNEINISDLEYFELLLISDILNKTKQFEELYNYLIPLSRESIEKICLQSFYSLNDNTLNKFDHYWIIKLILENFKYDFDSELFQNVITISNLYKEKLKYYANLNLKVQKLKKEKDPVALELQELENKYNNNPSDILEEEIAQIKSKLYSNLISDSNALCNLNLSNTYNSLNKNELLINIISYKGFDDKENYYLNIYNKDLHVLIDYDLTKFLNIEHDKIINNDFFDKLNDLFVEFNSDINQIDTIYIIPSGDSFRINFNSLLITHKNLKKVKTHLINSITDIAKLKAEKDNAIKELVLIGDIDYDKQSKNIKIDTSYNIASRSQLKANIKDSDIPYWGYLPDTKYEIEEIDRIATNKNIATKIINGSNATESNIIKLLENQQKPNIVHIATHGYFFPDVSKDDFNNFFISHQNPLVRSGIILSGANKSWNKETISDSANDGILTAEEISFMDFSGVDLVVLSACDTGRGDVSNLDGVLGLQRALKLAGANKLIMSLWKVPDKETAEFFKHFYKFLLEDKRSINESFRQTQKIMNEKYEPYFWASFILLE